MGLVSQSKDELAKKLASLSKRLRDVFEILKRQQETEEDGMFTKKNLSPVNCASCDKNLVNMLG